MRPINEGAIDFIRSQVNYDPISGVFTWACGGGKRKVGAVAGSAHKAGYRELCIGGRRYLGHRIAWLITYGEWPRRLIDHIDGDTSNNAIANLREASRAENAWNCPLAKQGFSRDSQSGKLLVHISVDGQKIYIGRYDNEVSARSAYLVAKRKYHGEFFPIDEVAA